MKRHALYEEAKEFVIEEGYCSCESLRNQFGIGYNAAGMLIDQLEEAGIISAFTGSKNRTVLKLQPPTEPKTEESK